MHIVFEKILRNLENQKSTKKSQLGRGFEEMTLENKMQRQKRLPAIVENGTSKTCFQVLDFKCLTSSA